MIPAPKTVWAYAWVEPSPNGEGAVRASGRGSREATEAEQKDRGRSVLLSHVEEYVPAAEVTRLRAALAGIAALQTEEPVNPLTEDIGPRDVYPDMDDCFEGGMSYGMKFSRYEASSLAAKALGGGT